MSEWSFERAARESRGELALPDPQKRWQGASIDTRTLKSGEVFFALKGKNQDGHEHLWDAFRKGASGAVVDKQFFRQAREKIFRERSLFHNLLLVSDPEESLAALAASYRSDFSALSIGITGSVAKTGTKEFLRFLLAQKHPVLATSGNQNNHLGLPLTLFRLKPEHVHCVAELGASRQGEIRFLSSLLRPKIGILTGVSPAHLEGFGSLDRVYEAKLELAEALARNKGTLVLPDRDPELIRKAKKRRATTLFFGKRRTSDFRLSSVRVHDGWVSFEVNDRWHFQFPGHAAFQAENALAALAAAFACGISPSEFPSLWKDVFFPGGRFEVTAPREGVVFINDGYNASPYSFEKAIETFDFQQAARKILVLGDMLELGSESARYHRELGQILKKRNFHVLLGFGPWMQETVQMCEMGGNPPLSLHFEDKEMLTHFLGNFLKRGDALLFKGSRGMRLEEIIHALSLPLSAQRTLSAL